MRKTSMTLLSAALLAPLACTSVKADTLAIFTFEASQPGVITLPASPGAGVAFPGFSAETGSGTATALHAAASTYSSPAGNGSPHSFSSTAWTVGDYYQFQISTLGDNNVTVSFDQTSSNTGPGQFQFGYSTDGVNFTSFGAQYAVLANASPNPAWNATTATNIYNFSYNLSSVSALNNQSAVYFRLTDAGTVSANLGAVAPGGTDRVDNFTVQASPVPEPSMMALSILGGVALLGLRTRRFRV